VTGGVEIVGGFDAFFHFQSVAAVVLGEQGLQLVHQVLGAVGGQGVALDAEGEALPEEFFRVLAQDREQGGFIGQRGVFVLERDEDFALDVIRPPLSPV
jgi:hypothetical protein